MLTQKQIFKKALNNKHKMSDLRSVEDSIIYVSICLVCKASIIKHDNIFMGSALNMKCCSTHGLNGYITAYKAMQILKLNNCEFKLICCKLKQLRKGIKTWYERKSVHEYKKLIIKKGDRNGKQS